MAGSGFPRWGGVPSTKVGYYFGPFVAKTA